jgi:hypothetical protein
MSKTLTSHIDKKNIFDIFVDFLIFIHFHYMKMHRLLSSLQNYLWTMLRPMIEDLKNEKKRRLMSFQNELKL